MLNTWGFLLYNSITSMMMAHTQAIKLRGEYMQYSTKLTPMQRKFCEQFAITGDQTKSYLEAGYKCKNASANGNASRLLQKPKVKRYLKKLLEEAKTSKVAELTEVLEFFTSVMRGEIKEEMAFNVQKGDFTSKIEKTKVEVAPKDRINAAKELYKRYEKQTPDLSNQLAAIVDAMLVNAESKVDK